jgi:hypothetical protein
MKLGNNLLALIKIMEEKFERCVKKVKKSSGREALAIAVCTKNVLWKRGYTLKKYRKGKLITQKRK